MEDLNSREALLAGVRSLRDDIERVVAEAGEERATQPGSFGELSFKDIIAHLTGWRQVTVARLEAGLRDAEPSMPWPAHLNEDDDLDEINRWFYETNRDKPLSEIMRESRETFERAERAIAALPERELLEVSRFSWLEGYALGPGVVRGTLDHYHEDHEPEILAWLARS